MDGLAPLIWEAGGESKSVCVACGRGACGETRCCCTRHRVACVRGFPLPYRGPRLFHVQPSGSHYRSRGRPHSCPTRPAAPPRTNHAADNPGATRAELPSAHPRVVVHNECAVASAYLQCALVALDPKSAGQAYDVRRRGLRRRQCRVGSAPRYNAQFSTDTLRFHTYLQLLKDARVAPESKIGRQMKHASPSRSCKVRSTAKLVWMFDAPRYGFG